MYTIIHAIPAILVQAAAGLFTPEKLAAYAGVAISAAFKYVPTFKAWFDTLTSNGKRWFMMGAMALTAAALYGAACAGVYGDLSCTQAGLAELIVVFGIAAGANQAAYLMLPDSDPQALPDRSSTKTDSVG